VDSVEEPQSISFPSEKEAKGNGASLITVVVGIRVGCVGAYL